MGTRKVVPEIEAFRKSIPDSHSNTPSVSSYRSNTGTRRCPSCSIHANDIALGRSRITSGQKSRAASSGLGKTSEKDDKAGQIFDLEEDDLDKEYGGGSHSMSGTGQMFESLQKAVSHLIPSLALC